jgi:MFS family permease
MPSTRSEHLPFPSHTGTRLEDEAIFRKITVRLIPLLFACYLLNFTDRANIGFAHLQMKSALGFSDAVYGLGAAVFFVGYAIFEVPSNILLRRVGARATILRIMLLWGLTSAGTMFVQTPAQFYLARFLLGVFEAGFFPGIVLYLTYWFPAGRRAKVLALITTAQVVAAFITSPLSGWILKNMHGLHGWEGWQWMFLLEGMPTVVLGLVVYLVLPNGPHEAKWLGNAERAQLQRLLREQHTEDHANRSVKGAFVDPYVYLLSFGAFVYGCAGYFLTFWMPTIIKELGVADLQMVGIYALIPNVFGAVAMVLYGRLADRRNEQRRHWCFAFVMSAVGFVALAWTTAHSLVWTLVAMTFSVSALAASMPVLWSLITRYLSRENAPTGIAYINTLASIAGMSPAVVGAIKARTGSLEIAIYILSIMLFAAAISVTYGMRKATTASPANRETAIRAG